MSQFRQARRTLAKQIGICALLSTPLILAVTYPLYKSHTSGSQAAEPVAMATAALKASGKNGLTPNVLRAANRETKKMMDMRAKFGAEDREKQVAVFVGGTSGLGLLAMKKWIHLVGDEGGRIYFVGRNKEVADQLVVDFRRHYPQVAVEFIHTPDIALLSNAEKVASTIASKESHINLLVLSQGLMTLSNTRNPTSEGIERKMATNVYSRYLITRRLLPLLQKAHEIEQATEATRAAPSFAPPRVMSIFSPGTEGVLNEEDMELSRQENFSTAKCAGQASAMNSLMMEHLAKLHPELGWLHVSPGVVMTGLTRDLPNYMQMATPIMSLMADKDTDVKEGLGWLATRKENGLQLVDWKGNSRDTRINSGPWWAKYFGGGEKWWREGLSEIVWRNQEEVEERVLGKK